MAKTSAGKPAARRAKPLAGSTLTRSTGRVKAVQREAGRVPASNARFEAVMRAAEQSGLLGGKHARIGGRVSPELVRQAKRQTGIEADTDLIEFALATIALEDNFSETFKGSRGKVNPELKLGF
jgi:hypothetical protein